MPVKLMNRLIMRLTSGFTGFLAVEASLLSKLAVVVEEPE
jgi:hypothetical protein